MSTLSRAAVIALVIACASVAHAYTIKMTSTGLPVHWPGGATTLTPALAPHPAGVTVDGAEQALVAAAAAWQPALIGSNIELGASTSEVSPLIHGADGVNQVRWAYDASDPDVEPGVLALTFVSYRPADGTITDADIVVNAAAFHWTTTPETCAAQYDLQAALTHEVGHLLGLGHSAGHPEATMFATSTACESTKRVLSADDAGGVSALYAAASTPAAAAGCAAGSGAGGLAAIGVGLALARGRRRRAVRAATLLTVIATLAPPAADAARLRPLPIAELSRNATLIVRGRVTRVAVDASAGEPATDATVTVDECLAGPCPSAVVVRRRGGEVGDRGLWVEGEAELAAGDPVVLYLRVDRAGALRAYGGVQGAFRVARVSGTDYAVRDLRSQELWTDGAVRPGSVERVPLAQLRAAAAR